MGGPPRNCFCDITRVCRSYANVLQLHTRLEVELDHGRGGARSGANVLQLHTRLEVELDHGRGGARSGAGCPQSESSGTKVHVQPTVTAIFNRFTLRITRYRATRLCSHSAVYHRKQGPRTTRLNLVTNRLLIS